MRVLPYETGGALHQSFTAGCQQCHGSESWKPATFDHSKHFLLQGEHDAACKTCHVADDFTQFTCYGCHEHTPANIRAKHAEEGIRNFENCTECHRSGDEGGEGGDDD